MPIGAAAVGVGALLFAVGQQRGWRASAASCRAPGASSRSIGAAYIATTNFPASRAATLIGATQMFGMAGGSAGQFLVGPVIASGVPWSTFWIGMGVAGLAISVALYFLLPPSEQESAGRRTAPAPRRR